MKVFGLLGRGLVSCITGSVCAEYLGHRRIPLRATVLPDGTPARAACGLMVQTIHPDGTVWASRGYHLYRLAPGAACFRRVLRMPCPLGKAWMGHFAFVRDHFHRPDFVDAFQLRSGAWLVFSGGFVFRRGVDERRFQKVHRFRKWGLGIGRGLRPTGFVQMRSGSVLFGEYFRNSENGLVRLYASDDDGRTWPVRHTLAPGVARHVHALQQDPYEGGLWLCTGDSNEHSFVAVSHDEGRTFERVGGGSQAWRVCKLLFTPTHVCWGSDTNLPERRGFFRWERACGRMEQTALFDGPVLSATILAGGTWVVGTDREGRTGLQWCYPEGCIPGVTEPDEHPSLWVSVDGLSWKRLKLWRWLEAARPAFGVPQFAFGDGAPMLAMTCLNMEEYDGRLFLIRETDLRTGHGASSVLEAAGEPETATAKRYPPCE